MPKKRPTRVRCRSLTVRSIGQYVDVIQELQEEWSEWEEQDTNSKDGGLAHVWFRGHADKGWALTPKIFRTKSNIRVVDEEELYSEFVRRGGSLMGALPDGWHSYFVMQHHGIPTRLLDWTDSGLVALYFALKDARTDAAVWALNPCGLIGRQLVATRWSIRALTRWQPHLELMPFGRVWKARRPAIPCCLSR